MVRIGNPWVAIAYVTLFTVGVGSFALYVPSAWTGLTSGEVSDPVVRSTMAMMVVVGTLAGALVVTVAALAVWHPRMFTRTVVLTPSTVTTPSARGRKVPLDQICGVGLVLQRVGNRPGGMWMLTLWTLDGKTVRAGTLLRKQQMQHVEDTTIWHAARVVHAYVTAQQGPVGALARQQRQQQVVCGPFTPFAEVRDPVGT